MLEICVSGFLVISAVASILLWRALAVAKRADYGLYGTSDVYHLEPAEGKFHFTATIPSGND
jgi:hypothetical protein